jgi:hypothetical protein
MWGHSTHSSDVVMDPRALKRTYSGDSSDDNCSYWTEVGSHNSSISTRHQQQRKRLFRQVSPAPPFVSVWDHRIQTSPESYRGFVKVASSPVRLNRASASSSEPSRPGSCFQSLHTAPSLSPASQNSPIPFGNVMRDEWRNQPHAVAKCPTNSGSDDSRTPQASYSAPCAANQGGGLEFIYNVPDDLSYTFPSEALSDYRPTDDLSEHTILQDM